MEALFQNRWAVAGLAFLAVALTTVTGVLLWEAYRSFTRQRSVKRELQRISGAQRREEKPQSSLLREVRGRDLGWLEPVLLRIPHRQDLQHLLEQADSSWSVGGYLMLTGGFAAAFGTGTLVLTANWMMAVAATVVGALLPYLTLRRQRKKRSESFEALFPDAIDLLGRSIRAGHAFSTGLKVVADESPEPVASEFRQVFEEQKFGLPLRESLLALADRLDLVDVRVFVTSVMIQRETGGNLAENLDNLAEVIRERFKFKREVRTHTAQGRMTGYVLGAAPIAAFLVIWALNPEYIRPLIEEPLGHRMLGFAAGSQLIGFFIIRRLIDVEF